MAELEETLKKDYMMKRSQMKGRLKQENFRGRLFILSRSFLRYCEGTTETGPTKTKGLIELSTVITVDTVNDNAFEKPNFFQIVYNAKDSVETTVLYVQASHADQRDQWISAVRKACAEAGARMSEKYHPGIYRSARYTCCLNQMRLVKGCLKSSERFNHELNLTNTLEEKPPLPAKLPTDLEDRNKEINIERKTSKPEEQSNAVCRNHPVAKPRNLKTSPAKVKVVATYNYNALEPGDLCLKRGEEYEILENVEPYWWKAKNKSGETGFIPSNYVHVMKENESDQALRNYDWFYPDTSLTQAEEILESDGRPGCFLLRNSRHVGMFSLSLMTVSLNGEKRVKHYHIRSSDEQYYIFETQKFSSVAELITYHQKNTGGLSVKLGFPPGDQLRNSVYPTPAGLGHETKDIRLTELTFMEMVGTGNFGKVVHGMYKGSVEVAIKMIRPNCVSESGLKAEARKLATLHHNNLVQLYGICSEANPLHIVTEFMKYGSLLSYIRRNKHKIVQETMKLIDVNIQVCEAMVYLESKGFIHRDLTARNCLVGENAIIKVTDASLFRFVIDNEESRPAIEHRFRWAAPEVLLHQQYSSKGDVWSFGVLMWEVFTGGEIPYGKSAGEDMIQTVCQKKERLPKPERCPENAFKIMSTCWTQDSKARPTFSVIFDELDKIPDY